jgi:acetyl-CoA carboxylase carboxyl transferase subunit alpha
MGITAERLRTLGLVDDVIAEPLGGAHRNPQAMGEALKNTLLQTISELQALSDADLVAERRKRLRGFGVYKEA